MKYRKKPIEVMAFRIGHDKFPEWINTYDINGNLVPANIFHLYDRKGDWITKDEHGEYDIIKHDIFIATYEAVE